MRKNCNFSISHTSNQISIIYIRRRFIIYIQIENKRTTVICIIYNINVFMKWWSYIFELNKKSYLSIFRHLQNIKLLNKKKYY